MPSKYQTLSEFMASPFGSKANIARDKQYDTMYQNFIKSNSIYIKAYSVIEDSWYILVRVPSESQKGLVEYDVVIRFFTEDPDIKNENHLRNYKIQFFSNSPGFIYHYAYIYYKNGFLIKDMYSKSDTQSITNPPNKTNPNMSLSYDKSIYFACKFLSTNKFGKLNKNGSIGTKLPYSSFFSEISTFKDVSMYNQILSEEKKLKRQISDAKTISDRREAVGKYASKKYAMSNTLTNKTDTGIKIKSKLGYKVPKQKKQKLRPHK